MVYIVSQDGMSIHNLGNAEKISNQNGTIVIEHGDRKRVIARYRDTESAQVRLEELIDMVADTNSIPFNDSTYVYWFGSEDK